MLNAIVIAISHACFESGKNLFQFPSGQISRLVNRAAMITAGGYVTMPVAIHNSGIPWAKIVLFLNETSSLQALFEFRKNCRIAATLVVFHPKSGRTLVCVVDHYIDCIDRSLFRLFVLHIRNLR